MTSGPAKLPHLSDRSPGTRAVQAARVIIWYSIAYASFSGSSEAQARPQWAADFLEVPKEQSSTKAQSSRSAISRSTQANEKYTQFTPEQLTRVDVQRFSRIVSLMTAEQTRSYSILLPKVDHIPPNLKSLTAAESETATLMLAWMILWKSRHEEITLISPIEHPKRAYSLLSDSRHLPVWRSAGLAPAKSPALPSDKQALIERQISQIATNRMRELQQKSSRQVSALNDTRSAAKKAYEHAVEDYRGKHTDGAWSHIIEAMSGLNHLTEHLDGMSKICAESDATLQALAPAITSDLRE